MCNLQPLGDRAVLARFETEAAAARWAAAVRRSNPAWLVDVVPAYFTVAVFIDSQIQWAAAAEQLRLLAIDASAKGQVGRRHVIPCCYELNLDLPRVARYCGMTPPQVVELHSSVEFNVYAIGFCPGFPYLGYLPADLAGVPRLDSPRLSVPAGSVGMTGRQTGIYPLVRPGGWNLIGRTPLRIVDLQTAAFPIQVGDCVRFRPISVAEFDKMSGQNL